jgi:hypothetical protein
MNLQHEAVASIPVEVS